MNHSIVSIYRPLTIAHNSEDEETVNAASAASSSSSSNIQARGDFNGDGFDDLAIGSPFEDLGTIPNAGLVQVLYGTATGLDKQNDQTWFQVTRNGSIGSR